MFVTPLMTFTFAARTLHYYFSIAKTISKDADAHQALLGNARFWSDYNYMTIQTTVIFLGKIFDPNSKTYNLSKMINSASKAIPYFNREALRKRKTALGVETEIIDGYIPTAYELSKADIKAIKQEIKKANALWDKIEPFRNKIYAHSEILTSEERLELFGQVKYDDLKDLIQILLNISHALEQAELNGMKPDLAYNFEGPIRVAEGQIENLMASLTWMSRKPT